MQAIRALFPPFVGGRMGIGLLVLRIVLGLGMMTHGWGKIQNPTGWMDRPGKPPSPIPDAVQALGAAGEFLGGLGLIVGALTPIAALGVLATMIGAVMIAHSKDPWLTWPWVAQDAKTWESAGFYLFGALALILLGPGRFSIDALLFGRRDTRSGGHDEVRLPGKQVRT